MLHWIIKKFVSGAICPLTWALLFLLKGKNRVSPDMNVSLPCLIYFLGLAHTWGPSCDQGKFLWILWVHKKQPVSSVQGFSKSIIFCSHCSLERGKILFPVDTELCPWAERIRSPSPWCSFSSNKKQIAMGLIWKCFVPLCPHSLAGRFKWLSFHYMLKNKLQSHNTVAPGFAVSSRLPPITNK